MFFRQIANFFDRLFRGRTTISNINDIAAIIDLVKNKQFERIVAVLTRFILEAINRGKISFTEIGLNKISAKISECVWLITTQEVYYKEHGVIDPKVLEALDAWALGQGTPPDYRNTYRLQYEALTAQQEQEQAPESAPTKEAAEETEPVKAPVKKK